MGGELRLTVTLLLGFCGLRQTKKAIYRSTRTLSQWGTAPYWLELNWMLVMNTVSNRLVTISARVREKKTSAANSDSKKKKKWGGRFSEYCVLLPCLLFFFLGSIFWKWYWSSKPEKPAHSSACIHNYHSCQDSDHLPGGRSYDETWSRTRAPNVQTNTLSEAWSSVARKHLGLYHCWWRSRWICLLSCLACRGFFQFDIVYTLPAALPAKRLSRQLLGARKTTNLKQQQCQCTRFEMMVRAEGAPPDFTYSLFKWRVLDRIINKPNINKVETKPQTNNGGNITTFHLLISDDLAQLPDTLSHPEKCTYWHNFT